MDLNNRHCLITGGSAGLGLEFSKLLAQRGASITIFGRKMDKLDKAVEEISQFTDKLVIGMSVDCLDAQKQRDAISKAIEGHKQAPYLLVCNVGKCVPKTFLDHEDDDFAASYHVNYTSAVFTIRAALKPMIQMNSEARIVFISTGCGPIGIGGYSSYVPVKMALKSLADCLRHELLGTKIKIHVFMPTGFTSPGFIEEERIKPEITRLVEERDTVISPSECAMHLLRGLDSNHYIITASFVGELLRCASLVHSPRNNWPLDFLKAIVAFVFLTLWRIFDLDRIGKRCSLYNKPL